MGSWCKKPNLARYQPSGLDSLRSDGSRKRMENNNNTTAETTAVVEESTGCTIFCAKLKGIKNTSPANILSSRAVFSSPTSSIIATGTDIVNLNIKFPNNYTKKSTKIKGIPAPIQIDECIGETIIDSKLTREIQSIAYSRGGTGSSLDTLAVIDNKGNISVFDNTVNGDTGISTLNFRYSITSDNKSEPGWCGVSVNHTSPNIIASCSFYDKQVRIYDNGKLVSSYSLANHPTQIAYLHKDDSHLLAVSEQNQLNIIDTKTKEIIQKFIPTTSNIYSLETSTNGLVAVGGEGRTIHVYESKRWANVGNWSGCLKYEITGINFSDKLKGVCYVSGMDSEILAGDYDGSSGSDHFAGIRVDSRWLGITKLNGHESLFGFTSSGGLYWVHDADKLYAGKKIITKLTGSKHQKENINNNGDQSTNSSGTNSPKHINKKSKQQ
ncbi:hypothetical protein DFA_12006 [Cavenderia fasciculata]|uniref:WD40 repeat-containing protein n=1 Tax=Cavenderia fasciculata TaxID=261658 RepID=F4QF82_CACFS|nr:uncharacterized protein DFA_12006 [Cavenderia fasciculata]EGG14236.1 hypothetical protein DFA_12006 [Cavenderia fasciculata]|eukprot:XP_004350945.1 hypothetical protein DFA_12006 [Cavenderia fasciculata]